MKMNLTLLGRGFLAALVVVNGGLATLDLSDGLKAGLALLLAASIAFLGTVLPQPIAVLRAHYQGYRRLNASGKLDK
jgi:hypothetical protein